MNGANRNLREKRYEKVRTNRKRDTALAYDEYAVPLEMLPLLKFLSHGERGRVHIGKITPRSVTK